MNVYKHPDWLALEAGIVEDPDNDLRRLIVADWLTENGDEDRGEFIRLQVESADYTLPAGTASGERQAALFRRYRSVWWPGLYTVIRQYPSPLDDTDLMSVRVKRGWPAMLVGRATDILRGRRCGAGCWPSSVSNRCVVCDDLVRDRPYGYEIVREQPVTKVVLTDNDYSPYYLNAPSHDRDASHRDLEWFLTSEFWHLGDKLSGAFETEQDALDALSDAIIADARSV